MIIRFLDFVGQFSLFAAATQFIAVDAVNNSTILENQ